MAGPPVEQGDNEPEAVTVEPPVEQGDNEPEVEPEAVTVEPPAEHGDTEPEAESEAVTVEPPVEQGDNEAEAEPVETPAAASPYDMPGDWYVIHSYSGYENKVKANLETRIQSMHMGDRISEVHIPMEDVVEFKAGKKVTVPKKVFPGYILVRMTLDDDSWYAVRNTPGVTGFVAGNAQKPTPLSRREVERFLGVQEEEEKAKPRFKPEWEVGEQVRVVTGPFADFNGVIEDMNVDQQKVTVLVNIFGRDTPVELGFEDIQKS
jgi:transcriptional antiterminator NusG